MGNTITITKPAPTGAPRSPPYSQPHLLNLYSLCTYLTVMGKGASKLLEPVDVGTQRNARKPVLPTELWVKILSYQYPEDHLPYLWIDGRRVSTTFQEAIETMFQKQILPTCEIDFNLGTGPNHDYLYEESETQFRSESNFSHLSDDRKEIAVFTFKTPLCPCSHQDEFQRLLQEYGEDVSPSDPQHNVQIRRCTNDTPLPWCSVQWNKNGPNKNEMTLNWKKMFTYFYGEELIYMREKQKRETLLADSTIQAEEDKEKALLLDVQEGEQFQEDFLRSLARMERIKMMCEERGLDFSKIRYHYPASDLRLGRDIIERFVYWWEDDFPMDFAKKKELRWRSIIPDYRCIRVEKHEYPERK